MRWSVLVVAMLAFAGCVEDEPVTENPDAESGQQDPEKSSSDPQGGSSGTSQSPAPTGACEPEVAKAGSQYVARCSVRYSLTYTPGDDAGFETGNGDVLFTGGPGQADIDLWGRGDTEAEAREKLAELTVTATDTHIDVNSEDGWNNQGADIQASTQTNVGELRITTGNGDIEVEVRSTDQILETGNGEVTTEGHIGNLAIITGNGEVEVEGDVADLSISSGNGELDVDVSPLESSSWVLETGNQEVTLRIQEDASRGYDISAMTGNGDITFETQETAPTGQSSPGSANEKTTGYEARSIQVDVDIFTGNGDIEVHGSAEQSNS